MLIEGNTDPIISFNVYGSDSIYPLPYVELLDNAIVIPDNVVINL